MRGKYWARTPLGPIDEWAPILRGSENLVQDASEGAPAKVL
jgi:hypothetical protein